MSKELEFRPIEVPADMFDYQRFSEEYIQMICRALCVPERLIEVDEWHYGVSRETPDKAP